MDEINYPTAYALYEIKKYTGHDMCGLPIIDTDCFDEEKRQVVTEYILKNKISRRDITRYAPAYPDRAMRAMIESEVIYSVT